MVRLTTAAGFSGEQLEHMELRVVSHLCSHGLVELDVDGEYRVDGSVL